MPRTPEPGKIYYAILDNGTSYTAICIAQDGEVVFSKHEQSKSAAKYALTHWSQWDCKNKYPQGFQKIDLSKLSMGELASHKEFMALWNFND